MKPHESPQKNLEVPINYPVHSPDEGKEEVNVCVNIAVPNTKMNIVAPWEDAE